MIIKLVFLVVLVFPDGRTETRSGNVAACPDIKTIHTKYEELVDKGLIQQWDAQCLAFRFDEIKGEPT